MKEQGRFLFILGAHRSGTSLTAAACDLLGARLGENFIEKSEENPKGFFEDESVVALNDRILRSVDLSWDSFGYTWDEDFAAKHFKPYLRAAVALLQNRFADCPVAALKDPRLCILLPFWKMAVKEALDAEVYYLITVRSPEHCAQSQRVRAIRDGDFHLLGHRREHALLLWLNYYHHALRGIEAENALFLSYESMVANPEQALRRLAGFLQIDLVETVSDEFCTNFVDASLDRSAKVEPVHVRHNLKLWQWASRTYQGFLPLTQAAVPEAESVERLIEALNPSQEAQFFQRETQHMYGHAYKKILSLRYRLIRCIRELGEDRAALDEEQRKSSRLMEDYDDLDRRFQEILDSRAWQMIVRLRRYRASLLKFFHMKSPEQE